MFPTQSFVRTVLGPYEAELSRLLQDAMAEASSCSKWPKYGYKRTRAVLVHEEAMNLLRQRFGERQDVRLLESHETIRLLVSRQIVVRLKKMDARGYTRAQPTQATLGFTNEAPLPFGDDVPDVHSVDVGYVLNDLETAIVSILVAARYGEEVVWCYEAKLGEGERPGPDAFIPPARPVPSGAENVIRLPLDGKGRKDNERK